ncbi:hypothetical protein [Porphyrobacter sp. GA68]|uniref:hypothetical protein n=1 Tax=Porphyrobacter sp. GA68 TaxID=2883480 RepID=UPI001D18202A|nr:hypothetical protein [Porphyrobacter sp. GA68]
MAGAGKKPWFAVKRYGYGAGLPISWEGWLVLSAYMLAMIGSALFMSAKATFVVLAVTTPLFVYVAYVRSDAEWRWCHGE